MDYFLTQFPLRQPCYNFIPIIKSTFICIFYSLKKFKGAVLQNYKPIQLSVCDRQCVRLQGLFFTEPF